MDSMGLSRIARITVVAIASIGFAGTASAAMMMHDDFTDFETTWFHNGPRTGMVVEQMADSVMLSSGSDSTMWYAAISEIFLPTSLRSLEFDYTIYAGDFVLLATKFDLSDGHMGSVNLGWNPGSTIDLSNTDWSGVEYIRLQVGLKVDSQIELKDLKAYGAASAHMPEPTAAMLMGLGMLVTTAGMRRRAR
jgi:hypothetical protein